jgi:hypothetical protein
MILDNNMPDFNDACRLALRLPEVVCTEISLEIGGKGFAWTYARIVPGRKGRIAHPDVLAIRTTDLDEKDALIASDPEKFFTDPHYRGYPAVLTRLALLDDEELYELLETAWLTRAAKKDLKDWDTSRFERSETARSAL